MATVSVPRITVGFLTLDEEDAAEPTTISTGGGGGQEFTLTATLVPCARGDQPLTDARAMAWASIEAGQIVPVTSPVRPALNGLYEVAGDPSTSDMDWPASGRRGDPDPTAAAQPRTVEVPLRRIAGPTVRASLSVFGEYFALGPGITWPATTPRVVIPGTAETLPAGFGSDPIGVNPPGAYAQRFSFSRGVMRSATVLTESAWWYALSPRLEVYAQGQWVPVHGQPPSGYRVRAHNGVVGIEVPYPAVAAEGSAPAEPATPFRLLVFNVATGAQTTSINVDRSNFLLGFSQPSGVTVSTWTPEVLRFGWTERRVNLFGATQVEGNRWEIEMRRGVPYVSMYCNRSVTVNLPTAHVADVNDADTDIVGVKTVDNVYLVGQRSITPTTVPGDPTVSMPLGPRMRFEVGSSARSRCFTYPTLTPIG